MDTVFQYSLNGVYLKSFETPILAAKDIGHKTSSHICGAMNGRLKSAGGFQWRNFYQEKIPSLESKEIVHKYSLDGEYLCGYKKIIDAAKSINQSCSAHIIECLNGKKETAGGFRWSREKKDKLRITSSKKYTIYQYSLDGEFIKEWKSKKEVIDFYGKNSHSLSSVINSSKYQAFGFLWYDIFCDKVSPYYGRKKFFKYDLNGNFIEGMFISEFKKKYPNISTDGIYAAATGRQLSSQGFLWRDYYVPKLSINVDNDRKKSIVYVYTNKLYPDKKYVGQTNYGIKSRASLGNGYKNSPKFYAAIQKYGWNNFEVEIVKKDLSRIEADILEKQLILKYDSVNNGYNTTYGGQLSYTLKRKE